MHGILESIKRDRQYSFSHWRYRLLHWTFSVDPKTPAESPLPQMLYTHLCPIFHLANILVIFFPLIVFVKAIIWIAMIVVTIGAAVFQSAKSTALSIKKFFEKSEAAKKKARKTARQKFVAKIKDASLEERKERGRNEIVKVLRAYILRHLNADSKPNWESFKKYSGSYDQIAFYGNDAIESFWNEILKAAEAGIRVSQERNIDSVILGALKDDDGGYKDWGYFQVHNRAKFNVLDQDEVKKRHAAMVARWEAAIKERNERQKKFRERMVFWINASRVVGKALTYALCAFLIMLSVYATFAWILPALWYALCALGSFFYETGSFLLSVNLAMVGSIIWYISLGIGAVTGLIIISHKLRKSKTANKIGRNLIVTPFENTADVLGGVLVAVGTHLGNALAGSLSSSLCSTKKTVLRLKSSMMLKPTLTK